MQSTRQKKVASEISKVLAEFLNLNVANLFPAIIVSVVRCEISQDLKNANVYVSIYDYTKNLDSKVVFNTILQKASLARREVAKKCNLKFTPLLNFILDEGFENEDRINSTLKSLNKSE